ncbi:MAG: hypothetical protein ACREO5_14725 [Candidatus Binatia bacterium]
MNVIEGNAAYIPIDDFRTKIQGCLDLLQSKAPTYTNWLTSYNLRIRAAAISGANFADTAIDIAAPTFNSTQTWVASVLVHESVHFWQYKSGKYKAGVVAEKEANRYQLNVLLLIGSSAEEIAYMRKQDGGHADLDGDGKYTESDYRKRKY